MFENPFACGLPSSTTVGKIKSLRMDDVNTISLARK
jgi:hypothetical protein